MRYVTAYISLLRETYEDLAEQFESDTSRGFLIGLFVLTPVFGTLFFFAVLVNAAEYIAPTPSATIEAVQVSSTQIDIKLSENQSPLNAVEVEFFFNPAALLVTDVTIHDTLCEERFVITKEIDQANGRVFYQCGTVSPFTGTSTTLASLTVVPLTIGTTELQFGSSTNALAHDGYGSNVTKERIATSYNYSG